MSKPERVEMTPEDAAAWIDQALAAAREAAATGALDTALDAYVQALGLALQLGPAAAEQVLRSVLDTARNMARHGDTAALDALGPAIIDLVDRVREAGALPLTPIMDAWATVAADVAALISQVGLALTVAPARRAALLDGARVRAELLDDATSGLFALTAWLSELTGT